ncbi:hypothetical protein MAR_024346 [Mya arenaria]|uniref:Uncharacterized protein n=1 Tax=Mya arenaria TaxID=6604 RepID=A0ABY7DV42_MYAAR|nr:hypothetical protein MAR_024346 [Mya arenaria]
MTSSGCVNERTEEQTGLEAPLTYGWRNVLRYITIVQPVECLTLVWFLRLTRTDILPNAVDLWEHCALPTLMTVRISRIPTLATAVSGVVPTLPNPRRNAGITKHLSNNIVLLPEATPHLSRVGCGHVTIQLELINVDACVSGEEGITTPRLVPEPAAILERDLLKILS